MSHNSIAQAFLRNNNILKASDDLQVLKAIKNAPKFQEGWSLKTSYKTYQVLKHQGIAK